MRSLFDEVDIGLKFGFEVFLVCYCIMFELFEHVKAFFFFFSILSFILFFRVKSFDLFKIDLVDYLKINFCLIFSHFPLLYL